MRLWHRFLFSATMLHTLQGLCWIKCFLDTTAVISGSMMPSSKNATRRLILSLWQNVFLIKINMSDWPGAED